MNVVEQHNDKSSGGYNLWFVCPGCGENHRVPVNADGSKTEGAWGWNCSTEKPTFKPSVKVTLPLPDETRICHFFVREGVVEFCGDCTHEHAGKKLPMPEIEED